MIKFEPTTPNKSQYIATRWPNARNMVRPTMLRHVALACCDRLAGTLQCLRLLCQYFNANFPLFLDLEIRPTNAR